MMGLHGGREQEGLTSARRNVPCSRLERILVVHAISKAGHGVLIGL